MNYWPLQNLCSTTTSYKQHCGVILLGQLQPHQTRSWDSFLAQLMVMKLVQDIVPIVAVVLALQVICVQMSCGPCTLTDQRHRMALELGVS